MPYHVVSIKNEQFLVKDGTKIVLNGQIAPVGTEIKAEVLLKVTDSGTEIGTPYLKDSLAFTVLEHNKSPKIRVATYRAKSRYRKVKGHRQAQSVLELTSPKVPKVSKSNKKAVK